MTDAKSPLLKLIAAAMEIVVLLLVALTPWYYGGIEPLAVLGVHLGVALLLLLTSLRILVERKLPWRGDLIGYFLLGFIGLTSLQLLPLPQSILQVISPNTLQTWQRLIPETLEQLPGETGAVRATAFPLSLAPEETRKFLFGLMNLFVLYFVTRSYFITKKAFLRLALVALLNGVALSLFGLLQFFSCPRDVIYFEEKLDGAGVFSTFVCRNHFPDYAAMGLGLGATLLLVNSGRRPNGLSFRELLDAPPKLAVLLGLSTILIGIGFSLSRGGLLSLGVAMALIAALGWRRGSGFGPLLLIVPLALGVTLWLGSSPIDSRLSTLNSAGFESESRWRIWTQAWNLVPDYLPAGTGNGTFGTVETMARTNTGDFRWRFDMVHNEYLEALFEGGLPRLFLTVGLVLAMLISAGRALPRLRGRSAALMVLGTLFGLVALSVHSLVDFGIHLPGVALLAAVLLAHLSGWSASSNEIETRSTSGLLAIPILLLLGFLLATSGYDYFQAQEALRTSRLLAANVKEDTLDQRLKLLQTAVRLQPGDAEIHLVLGQTYLDASERFPPRTAEAESYLLAALREWREARNRSPVLPAPHARLGVYRDRFLQADSALNYFQRARTTAANDPNIWYVTGKFLFEAGEFERAWADWKRSLELGDDDFNAIITRAGKKLNSQQMVEQLLPANPDLLVRAAYLLHSRENESPPERRPYLLKAIELWKQTDSNASPDLVKLALLYREVGDFERAIPLLQKACDRDPTQITWRLQLAETYRDADRLKEAIEELQKLIREERGNKEIRDRLAVLRRELELRE